ncbi:MAG TPA: PilZ domain-containing protein [Candidatus Omnitrophica bacterium]|nr:PilZ domain-containing protein [Candidatus Omnitrophota bacterium]
MAQKEKRKYGRYNTEVEIYFRVNFDIRTKVKYRLLGKKSHKPLDGNHLALSRNISAEGLCFSSNEKLKKGSDLYLEIYIPKRKHPICMTGEVRWSKCVSDPKKSKYKFDTGVRLLSVSGKGIEPTIYFDDKHQVIWSVVLESILGSFRKIMQGKDK